MMRFLIVFLAYPHKLFTEDDCSLFKNKKLTNIQKGDYYNIFFTA